MFSLIFCSSFYPIPLQSINYKSEVSIDLGKYILSEDININYDINDGFDISDSNDSLYIYSKTKDPGLSVLKVEINNKIIDLIVYSQKSLGYDSIPEHSLTKSIIVKDGYRFNGEDIILSFKNVSRSISFNDLRNGNIKILFNNNIIEDRYIHIFKNKIRIMLPKSARNGLLRICATDEYENLYRENQTIISNGLPISNDSDEHSVYFSNIYYLMVDRFSDKNKENNFQVSDLSIDGDLKFHGGDLSGVLKKINNGYFDRLGISNILLSPIQSNPDSSFRQSIAPFKKQMGFDGSWPIDLTAIDSRFGNDEDLNSVINAAHKKDIKVFIEFIAGHTHEDHLYYELFPDWYNADYSNWKELFLPEFQLVDNHLIDQITLDAKYWIEQFSLDGIFTNLNHSITSDFSSHYNTLLDSGTTKNVFKTIKFSDKLQGAPNFVNPRDFDSELNFDLYLNARNHFSGLNTNFIELNNMIIDNLETYNSINLITTFVGLDNQPRFISVADGQVSYEDKKSSSYLESIQNPVSYERLFMFMVMNNSLPGIPMMYYGDEYGQIGGHGVDSKRDMKFQNELSISESYLKERVSKLNKLRLKHPALSIGDFIVLRESEEFTAWMKSYYNEKILIFFNLQDKVIEKNISLPFEANELVSLLDDSKIVLDDLNMASLVIPPYKAGIYILKSK
tara:strand:- start:178 stop:2211 length:2034 start_codon:yes stop_codon:yes gene_type:complete